MLEFITGKLNAGLLGEMFMAFTVVVVLWVQAYVQTCQKVYINYVQSLNVSYTSKLIKKKIREKSALLS